MPAPSLALFYAGVFCLFTSIGILSLMADAAPRSGWKSFLFVLYWGCVAVSMAVTVVRQKYVYLPFILAANLLAAVWLNRMIGLSPAPIDAGSRLHSQLKLLGESGILTLTATYLFFMLLFSREGTRYFRVHTEIELARELHQALVPAVDRRIGDFEIYGASIPSGEVGGDLVDLIERHDEWTAYVADVSGHGVSPGVLMAMFKAAVRARMLPGSDGGDLLQAVHQTLYPLKTSNMFITAGFLHAQDGRVTLSLAGHPALLHFRRQRAQVCEYLPANLPIGILPEQTFTSEELDCEAGDVLLLLTDGMTEVCDKQGAELGAEAIKSGLRQWADLPLPELFRNIRELALRHGKQEDDQTMLLVRRVSTGGA